MGWKDGIIRFDDTPLKHALTVLERWYDIEFSLDAPAFGECFIKSTYRNESLENILKSIKFINGIEYKLEPAIKKVTITRNQCN